MSAPTLELAASAEAERAGAVPLARSPRAAERARGQRTVPVRVRWLPPLLDAMWFLRTVKGIRRQVGALRGCSPKRRRWALGFRLVRRGFLPTSYAVYGVSERELADYLSDREASRTWCINLPASSILNDKLAFYFMLAHLGAPTPRVGAVIREGRLIPLERQASDGFAWLRESLEDGPLVVRPVRGAGGRNVLFVERTDSSYAVNGIATGWDALERRLGELDDCLMTEFVEQASYAREIFSRTTNTLRVVTMNAADGTGAFVVHAEHRFGTERSRPVDNWSAGGLLADVDVATGTLTAAAGLPRSGAIAWRSQHPDTGAAIEGTTVPHWEELKDELVSLAERLAFLPWIGWDVVVTDDGFSILEGNSSPDIGLQIFRPLLADPRVRAFFAAHGIIGAGSRAADEPA